MSTNGGGRASRSGRPAGFAGLAVLAALALGACGSTDFPNDPRPPEPKEISAKVDSKRVVVSPDKIGAGLVVFTIANLSDAPVQFTVSGEKTEASTTEIQPGAPANLKIDLHEGDYEASVGQSAQPATLTVGPERKSSQNRLLLP
jgi:hypothetical protein